MALKTVKTVLNEGAYRIKFVYAFIIVLLIAALLMNLLSLPGLLQGEIIFIEAISISSLLFLFIFSFLTSIAIVLHVYKSEKLKANKLEKSGIGLFGAFLGFFTTGCSVCYPLILTALGIPAALAILPFDGAEIQAASIVFLLLSIHLISKNIENCEKCKV